MRKNTIFKHMVSFVGKTSALVDANGRVSLPSIFRDVLPENEKKFYIATGKKNALVLFREDDYNEIERPRILSLPWEERINAASNAQLVVLDEKQNRFLLPKELREKAKIRKDVVFIGAMNKIIICSPETCEELGIGNYEYDL